MTDEQERLCTLAASIAVGYLIDGVWDPEIVGQMSVAAAAAIRKYVMLETQETRGAELTPDTMADAG